MAKLISEATKMTIDSMLRAGEYTWKICEVCRVSTATVQKRRNNLKANGYENIWHPRGGNISRKIRA